MKTDNLTHAEQRALNHLLDLAAPVPQSAMLADKILSATSAPTTNGKIIDLASKRPLKKNHPTNSSNWWAKNLWASGLMAASLTIGILSGTTEFANLIVTAPLELAGIEQTTDFDIYNVLDGFSATESLL